MKEGPDIARIASLVGDPARANMLTALMGGSALTASELALEAGVTLPTASSHLGKLMEGGCSAWPARAAIAITAWPRRRWPRCWSRSWAWRHGRAEAHAPRPEGRGDARGARLLRPPRRRTRGRDVRRIRRARHRRRSRAMRSGLAARARASSKRSASTPATCKGSVVRCAAPASTGACGARISPARSARRSSTRSSPRNGRGARRTAAWCASRRREGRRFRRHFWRDNSLLPGAFGT